MRKYTVRRRSFCKMLVTALIVPMVTSLEACSGIKPEKFKEGKVVQAPLGCIELLARNETGDC